MNSRKQYIDQQNQVQITSHRTGQVQFIAPSGKARHAHGSTASFPVQGGITVYNLNPAVKSVIEAAGFDNILSVL